MARAYMYHFCYTQEDYLETVVAEVEVEIEYNYIPGTPARINYDENDHPAESPEIDIIAVRVEEPGGKYRQASLDEFERFTEYAMDTHFEDMCYTATYRDYG